MSHEFLKIVKSISGGVASAEVKPIGNSEDEWSLNLEIPEYATCSCCPGPLPLPSAGSSLLVSFFFFVGGGGDLSRQCQCLRPLLNTPFLSHLRVRWIIRFN